MYKGRFYKFNVNKRREYFIQPFCIYIPCNAKERMFV